MKFSSSFFCSLFCIIIMTSSGQLPLAPRFRIDLGVDDINEFPLYLKNDVLRAHLGGFEIIYRAYKKITSYADKGNSLDDAAFEAYFTQYHGKKIYDKFLSRINKLYRGLQDMEITYVYSYNEIEADAGSRKIGQRQEILLFKSFYKENTPLYLQGSIECQVSTLIHEWLHLFAGLDHGDDRPTEKDIKDAVLADYEKDHLAGSRREYFF